MAEISICVVGEVIPLGPAYLSVACRMLDSGRHYSPSSGVDASHGGGAELKSCRVAIPIPISRIIRILAYIKHSSLCPKEDRDRASNSEQRSQHRRVGVGQCVSTEKNRSDHMKPRNDKKSS